MKDLLLPEFDQYRALLTLSQEEIEDMFQKQMVEDPKFQVPTPFEFLLLNAYSNQEYEALAERAFKFFIKKPITFLYEQKLILVGDLEGEIATATSLEDLVFFTEDDFLDFQNLIRESLGAPVISPPDPNMHPKKRAMLAKQRLRDRVKAQQEAKKGITIDNTIVAFCCMNLGISPLNIGELSYCAFNSLVTCYQNKEKYELDIHSLLAGADSKKVKPKYWIGNTD